nr:MAG TPA: hypothetical protein [Caudoviricetes sp.]
MVSHRILACSSCSRVEASFRKCVRTCDEAVPSRICFSTRSIVMLIN